MFDGTSVVVAVGNLQDCERFTWGAEGSTGYRGTLHCGRAQIPVVSYREPLRDGACIITGRLSSYGGRVQIVARRIEVLDFLEIPEADGDELPF